MKVQRKPCLLLEIVFCFQIFVKERRKTIKSFFHLFWYESLKTK